MTTYFVTRHPGAKEWANNQDINVDVVVAHLETSIIQTDDHVIGSLPVHLAAEVCQRGGHYHHLVIDIPPEARGQELTASQMQTFGAHLEEFRIHPAHPKPSLKDRS